MKEVLCFTASNLTAWKRAPKSSQNDDPEPVLSFEQRLSILGWCNYIIDNTDLDASTYQMLLDTIFTMSSLVEDAE